MDTLPEQYAAATRLWWALRNETNERLYRLFDAYSWLRSFIGDAERWMVSLEARGIDAAEHRAQVVEFVERLAGDLGVSLRANPVNLIVPSEYAWIREGVVAVHADENPPRRMVLTGGPSMAPDNISSENECWYVCFRYADQDPHTLGYFTECKNVRPAEGT